MVDVAKKLTKDNDNDGKVDQHGLGIDPELIRVAPFVWSHGGQFVDNMDQPTTFTMHSDAGVFALQKFFDLRTVHRVVPDDAEVEAEDNESRFSNGRLAMVMSSRRSTPTFRKANKFDWDIAGLPTHGQAASVLHSDAYCMTGEGHRLAVPGVRRVGRGAADHRGDRADRSIVDRDVELGRVPGSERQAGELEGLPGQHPEHPAPAQRLYLAGDRGQGERDSGARVLRNAARVRGSRADSQRDEADLRSGEDLTARSMAKLSFEGVSKSFGAVRALDDLDLEVADGELMVLVGPSGCGKTTALRVVAGLERTTAGRVRIGERDVTHLDPAERNVAMVFQNYAPRNWSAVRRNWTAAPPNCPAASASGSRWRGRWCGSRTCSYSTNHCPTWTPNCGYG